MSIARIAQRTLASSSRAAARPLISQFSTSSCSSRAASSSASSSAKTSAPRQLQNKKAGRSISLQVGFWLTFPVISECAPGTVMSGLAIFKGKPDPVAKADEEYPDWLWTILDEEKANVLAAQPRKDLTQGQKVDFEAERKRLKSLNKARIKAANFIKST